MTDLDRSPTNRSIAADVEPVLGQWLRGDPEVRRTIEKEIDRRPKRKKSN